MPYNRILLMRTYTVIDTFTPLTIHTKCLVFVWIPFPYYVSIKSSHAYTPLTILSSISMPVVILMIYRKKYYLLF